MQLQTLSSQLTLSKKFGLRALQMWQPMRHLFFLPTRQSGQRVIQTCKAAATAKFTTCCNKKRHAHTKSGKRTDRLPLSGQIFRTTTSTRVAARLARANMQKLRGTYLGADAFWRL